MSQPIQSKTTFKCLHCSEKLICEPRNRGRQCYCAKPECRRASKAASQRRWEGKPENENYFRGPENIERVRQWRKEHPGYWRRKKPEIQDALQDLCLSQPALLVGIISVMTGYGLQEDIAASARSFSRRAWHGVSPTH